MHLSCLLGITSRMSGVSMYEVVLENLQLTNAPVILMLLVHTKMGHDTPKSHLCPVFPIFQGAIIAPKNVIKRVPTQTV